MHIIFRLKHLVVIQDTAKTKQPEAPRGTYTQQPLDTSDVELPESEKEYNRHTSQETSRMILKSGFSIRKDLEDG